MGTTTRCKTPPRAKASGRAGADRDAHSRTPREARCSDSTGGEGEGVASEGGGERRPPRPAQAAPHSQRGGRTPATQDRRHETSRPGRASHAEGRSGPASASATPAPASCSAGLTLPWGLRQRLPDPRPVPSAPRARERGPRGPAGQRQLQKLQGAAVRVECAGPTRGRVLRGPRPGPASAGAQRVRRADCGAPGKGGAGSRVPPRSAPVRLCPARHTAAAPTPNAGHLSIRLNSGSRETPLAWVNTRIRSSLKKR